MVLTARGVVTGPGIKSLSQENARRIKNARQRQREILEQFIIHVANWDDLDLRLFRRWQHPKNVFAPWKAWCQYRER
jgi:hypothetical protein